MSKLNKPQLFIIFFLLLSLFPLSCQRNNEQVPYTYVNIEINLAYPQFSDLQSVGNYVFVTGGIQGIVIYRSSYDEFAAYDRASPSTPDNYNARVVSTQEFGIVQDTVNDVKYSLIYDGMVVGNGKAEPLQKYEAYFNEISNMVYISN